MNNFHIKRMVLRISLFSHGTMAGVLEMTGGKEVEISMGGNGVQKLRFQFPVDFAILGPLL